MHPSHANGSPPPNDASAMTRDAPPRGPLTTAKSRQMWGCQGQRPLQVSSDSSVTHTPAPPLRPTEAPEAAPSLPSILLVSSPPPSLSSWVLPRTVSLLAREAPSQVRLRGTPPKTQPQFTVRLRTLSLTPGQRASLLSCGLSLNYVM